MKKPMMMAGMSTMTPTYGMSAKRTATGAMTTTPTTTTSLKNSQRPHLQLRRKMVKMTQQVTMAKEKAKMMAASTVARNGIRLLIAPSRTPRAKANSRTPRGTTRAKVVEKAMEESRKAHGVGDLRTKEKARKAKATRARAMAKDLGTPRHLALQVLLPSMALRRRRTLQGVSTSAMASQTPTPQSPRR